MTTNRHADETAPAAAGTRATFGSKLGILAATAGSAVGLGNVWRFPSETANGGGAVFVLIYLACVCFFGLPVVLAEFILGRAGKANPAGAYRNLAPDRPFHYFGVFAVTASVLILGFYMVVAGWTFEYFRLAAAGTLAETTDFAGVFRSLSDDVWRQFFWLAVAVAATASIVGCGVKKGIEFASKLMMPLLFLLLLVMCARAVTLPGSGAGIAYLFSPDFSKLSPSVFISALGQSFFSLSLGMGCLITYASYFGPDVRLGKTAGQLAVTDTLVAVLAGVTIFGTAFSVGGNAGDVADALAHGGPGLIFVTLPQLFQTLPLGQFWATAFFLLLILATVTSAISIYEIATSFLHEEFRLSRVSAVVVLSALTLVFGFFSAASLGSVPADGESAGSLAGTLTLCGKTFFDWLDTLTAKWMMPLGGLFVSWFVGWHLDRKLVHAQLSNNDTFVIRFFRTYVFLLRFVAPVGIATIFLAQLLAS